MPNNIRLYMIGYLAYIYLKNVGRKLVKTKIGTYVMEDSYLPCTKTSFQ